MYSAGRPLAVGGPRQRALLALLLVEANRVVARDRLLDALHGDQDHAASDRALRVQVSRLRAALEAGKLGDRLVARSPGYLLQVAPEELDLLRFEQLVAQARAAGRGGRHEEAIELFREADSLWRGRPLVDVEFVLSAGLEADRLEELRLAAIERRIDEELALGRHAEVIPDLERLVAQHPFREAARGQLMLALYRSGRQADALAAYRSGRRLSVEGLALEPGRDLRELEQAILRQDDSLDPPGASKPPPKEPGASRTPPRRRVYAAAVCLLVAAGLVVAFASRVGTTSAQVHPLVGNGLMLVSTDSGRRLAAVQLRAPAAHIADGLGALWVTEPSANSVERVDAHAHAVTQTIPVGGSPAGIAVADGDVWVANTLDGTLSRIDGDTRSVVQRVRVGTRPGAVLAADGSVWVANSGDGTISRVDPVRGRVVRVIRVGNGPSCLAASAETLWVCNEDDGTVTRIEMRDNDPVDTINVGEAPSAIAPAPGGVWLLDRLDSTVSRVDATSDAVVETRAIGGRPAGLAVTAPTLWVSNDGTGEVVRLDGHDEPTTERVRVGVRADDVLATADGLWVAAAAGGPSHAGGTLRLVETTYGDDASIDPALQSFAPPLALQGLTNDSLVTLDHVPGPDGARLVPDLAISLPVPADSGTAYTFRLRSGIRYSSGGSVRADDVRHSFERLFDLRSVGADFFAGIVGARACLAAGSRHCSLADGISTNERLGTVTFRLTKPDPDFLYKLTLSFADVLPSSVPDRPSTAPLPATGPYLVRSAGGGRVVLVRNPRFHEWSHAAQPSGYPDRIVWLRTRGVSGPRLAVRGGADLAPVIGSLGRDGRVLRTRYPGELRVNWFPATEFWFLNVHAKPFDDARVRRAVNDAVDRERVVRIWGGPEAAAPTCQLLPPSIPGYVRYCPYSSHGRPDLRRARALVAQTRTRGARITLWSTPEGKAETRYLASVFRELGYRPKTVVLSDRRLFAYANNSVHHAQVIAGGWSADYPTASNFLGKLGCAFFVPDDANRTTDGSEFCDAGFDRQLAHAESLQPTDPAAALAAWARLDREVTDDAVLLPLVSFRETDVLSRRVGNYQYHLIWGPIVDQLWVR